jgi:hypothetical protein
VPTGAGWLHEPKLDGYRLQVVKEGRQVRLYSRNGNDWTTRLPIGHSPWVTSADARFSAPSPSRRPQVDSATATDLEVLLILSENPI